MIPASPLGASTAALPHQKPPRSHLRASPENLRFEAVIRGPAAGTDHAFVMELSMNPTPGRDKEDGDRLQAGYQGR